MASTQLAAPTTVPSPALIETTARNYVDWGAILAGVAVSSGLFSIFAAFTSAIGLALVPSTSESRMAATVFLVAAALWALWIQLSSTMAGAYITGRMRHRIGDAKPHEVEMRDGTHGLIMWAVSVIVSAVFAGWVAMAAGAGINAAISKVDVDTSYFIERMTRPQIAGAVAPSNPVVQEQASNLLARLVLMPNETDQAYLASQISALAGIPETEAATRVENTLVEMRATADSTRRFGVVLAFFTAVSLLIGAVSAWWAAYKGGEHRDQGIDHSVLTRFR
jgi:hypothetical protein